MTAAASDSAIYRHLLGDAEVGKLFTDTAEVRAMMLVEGALAKVQPLLWFIGIGLGYFAGVGIIESATQVRADLSMFLCEDVFGTLKGIGGGNLLICGASQEEALAAVRAAVTAINDLDDVILPFPAGIVRSGSKVGSKYPGLKASTNDAWCPSLRGQTDSELVDGENAVYEIVIDGLSVSAVAQAMKTGMEAAIAEPGVLRISAGNYGGNLGPHHFHLHRLSELIG